MVAEGRLKHLIVQDGDSVACLGDIAESGDSQLTLWASEVWEPTKTCRYVNGDVGIELAAGVSLPPEGSIVLVTGVWRAGIINDAVWRVPDTFQQPLLTAPPDKLKRAEVGEELSSAFSAGIGADASEDYLIAGGGTRDASWLWLRTLSAEVADRVADYPGRVDIFTSVIPVRV
jgi:hypothetical protein